MEATRRNKRTSRRLGVMSYTKARTRTKESRDKAGKRQGEARQEPILGEAGTRKGRSVEGRQPVGMAGEHRSKSNSLKHNETKLETRA